MLPPEILQLSKLLAYQLVAAGSTVTTVESCTGGLVGAAITALPGSSGFYPGGFVTYSNELKRGLVDVSQDTLSTAGAVSAATAIEMANGGRSRIGADYAIAITGIAGPDGGSDEKPVGTVWICLAGPDGLLDCRRFVFPGNRDAVRLCSCKGALEMAIQMLESLYEPLPHEQERSEA
jgi:PncC family amidohydrolase